MKTISKCCDENVSRRSLMRAMAIAAVAAPVFGAAGLAPDQAAAAAKMSKKKAKYQKKPKGNERCDNCKLFVKPDGCTKVKGTVAAAGWCKLWIKV